LVLLFFIYQRHKIVKVLKRDNTILHYGKKDAERALQDINDMSFYESKVELPLTMPVRINKLCDHLTDVVQNHSYKDVMAVFQTDFSDDFIIRTNSEALEKLLAHFLNDSSRFTHKGIIKLRCADAGEFIRFSITDTGVGLVNKPKNSLVGKFIDEETPNRFNSMNFNICQSISRLLHGRIWYDGDYTGGARFFFEIPKGIAA
jgi:K+-sensing histidine kinase KdpD